MYGAKYELNQVKLLFGSGLNSHEVTPSRASHPSFCISYLSHLRPLGSYVPSLGDIAFWSFILPYFLFLWYETKIELLTYIILPANISIHAIDILYCVFLKYVYWFIIEHYCVISNIFILWLFAFSWILHCN